MRTTTKMTFSISNNVAKKLQELRDKNAVNISGFVSRILKKALKEN